MRRIKMVLAVAAVLVAMLAAIPGPAAMAADWNNRGDDGWRGNSGWDNGWRGNNWNNWPFFANHCEWEFEDGWFWGPWGWQWGAWVLDC